MHRFSKAVNWIAKVGMVAGAAMLTAVMLLTVTNIIGRILAHGVRGTYELIELMMAVIIAFAMPYAAVKARHVVVQFLVARFSQRTQAILQSFVLIIFFGILVVMAWASVKILPQRALLGEQTHLLGVSYLPFRSIWSFGLVIFSLVILVDLCRVLRRLVKR